MGGAREPCPDLALAVQGVRAMIEPWVPGNIATWFVARAAGRFVEQQLQQPRRVQSQQQHAHEREQQRGVPRRQAPGCQPGLKWLDPQGWAKPLRPCRLGDQPGCPERIPANQRGTGRISRSRRRLVARAKAASGYTDTSDPIADTYFCHRLAVE